MANSSSGGRGGVGLCGLLFLVFLVLKLAGVGQVATWSWWWVTAPLWGGFALLIAIAVLAMGLKLIAVVIDSIASWRVRRAMLRAQMED